MNKEDLYVGQSVTYSPGHGKKEKGIIKGFASNGNPFVVYNCGEEWDNYRNYTGANTNPRDLIDGWHEE